jgi:hypothetical protein
MFNDNVLSDEWLQMNFPVGTGPMIIVGGDIVPSKNHYMEIEFDKNSDSAHFVIKETPEDRHGLRGINEEPVVSFSMPRALLLKIVRIIKVSADIEFHDDFTHSVR